MTAEIEDPRIDPSEDPPTDSHTLDLHQLSREDHGRLPDDTRRAVVALLRGLPASGTQCRCVAGDHPGRGSRPGTAGGNLFLRLSLDTERGLAFIENAPLEEAPEGGPPGSANPDRHRCSAPAAPPAAPRRRGPPAGSSSAGTRSTTNWPPRTVRPPIPMRAPSPSESTRRWRR